VSDVALAVRDIWKSYRIYHARSHSIKERVLSRRNDYEDFWALRDVTFDVPTGSTLGIIGANGSGKSTLLKVMARILTPDRGELEIRGSMSSLLELGTGFHPELSGAENIYLAGSLQGQPKRLIEKRYDDIVDFAGIEKFMDLPVKNYSSGMYARLAFAVAISVDPDVLLIDEVLSVGDEQFQMRCYERIADFRSQGKTIVLVSHSLDTIRSLCEDAVWLDEGHFRGIGRSHEVVADYLTEVHSASRDDAVTRSSSGDRWGSGEAEITQVDFLDGEGRRTTTVRSGDPVTVRVHCRSKAPLKDVVCGLAFYRAETLAHLFGQNTRGVAQIDLDGDAVLDFHIPSLPFLKGNHVVSVALHDETVTQVYDWHERRFGLLVFDAARSSTEAGLVHVDGSWSVHGPSTGREQIPKEGVTS
jgi:ABC-type polysaccharide/polyol phosphate transport system ATPase subunit